jgi:hypothetical protein
VIGDGLCSVYICTSLNRIFGVSLIVIGDFYGLSVFRECRIINGRNCFYEPKYKIMERIEMLSDIELRINDIDKRRDELKKWMDDHPDHPQYDEAEKLLFEMNKILDSLRMKYKNLEANISGDQKNITIMEQNIYSNIRAFDSAFTKAGSIFRGTRRT